MYDSGKVNSGEVRNRMLSRNLKILHLLSGRTLTAPELSDRLDVSTRTIRRDLDCLLENMAIFKDDSTFKYRRNPAF